MNILVSNLEINIFYMEAALLEYGIGTVDTALHEPEYRSNNFCLQIEPTESRISLNEKNFYTLRVPSELLIKDDLNFLQAVIDTANVAFSHNNSESKKIIEITCPDGASENLEWLLTELRRSGFDPRIKTQKKSRFVELSFLDSCSLDCVDRRLDDMGVNPITRTSQITHPGGPLVLHPYLEGIVPLHHVETVKRSLKLLKGAGSSVNRLGSHMGAEGEPGCGMLALLKRDNSSVGEILSNPDDLCIMMDLIRDKYWDLLASHCSATGTVVYPDGSSCCFDLDNDGDVNDLKSEKDLQL